MIVFFHLKAFVWYWHFQTKKIKTIEWIELKNVIFNLYHGHSVANIVKAFGYPKNTVFQIVVSLREEKYVKRNLHRPRNNIIIFILLSYFLRDLKHLITSNPSKSIATLA